MKTPTKTAILSDEAKKQLKDELNNLEAVIEKWWPDEQRMRRIGKVCRPALCFKLQNDSHPGVMGEIMIHLRDNRWDARIFTIREVRIFGKAKAEFRDVNKVLDNVANTAAYYITTHDTDFKQYCLQLAAWGAVEELADMVPDLRDPFIEPIKNFVEVCQKEIADKQDENVGKDRFHVAGTEILVLVEKIADILKQNPLIAENIDPEKLFKPIMFENLKKYADQLAEQAAKT